jgi:hypothetical protein
MSVIWIRPQASTAALARFVAKCGALVAGAFSNRRMAVHSGLVRSNQLLCCGGVVVGPSTVFTEQASTRRIRRSVSERRSPVTFN